MKVKHRRLEIMGKMTKAAKLEQEDAITQLRGFMTAGSKMYTLVRNVARSGMSRTISCYHVDGGDVRDMTWLVGRALGYTRAKDGGLKVPGCGMDMGFHLANSLSYALHGMPKDHPEGIDGHRAGYTIKHEWL
jgi:hypothetical protein